MSRARQYHKRQAKAIQRRRHTATERLQRDRRQAQQAAQALEQTLQDLGLRDNLVAEIEGRLRSQHKLLGKIFGIMFPPLFWCRTNAELCVCGAGTRIWCAVKAARRNVNRPQAYRCLVSL